MQYTLSGPQIPLLTVCEAMANFGVGEILKPNLDLEEHCQRTACDFDGDWTVSMALEGEYCNGGVEC